MFRRLDVLARGPATEFETVNPDEHTRNYGLGAALVTLHILNPVFS